MVCLERGKSNPAGGIGIDRFGSSGADHDFISGDPAIQKR